MIHKLWINLFIIISFCLLLQACASTIEPPKPVFTSTNKLENEAVLSDPLVKKDFRAMKKIAMNARLIKVDGDSYFSEADRKKLDELSELLIQRLEQHYHLNIRQNKIHTYIARNAFDSCYQYYNSNTTDLNGRNCHEFPSSFGSCNLCNQFIKTLRGRTKQIIHSEWYNHERIAALVDVFRLKNGDSVYMGLQFSPRETYRPG
jgi:hypothetical protein